MQALFEASLTDEFHFTTKLKDSELHSRHSICCRISNWQITGVLALEDSQYRLENDRRPFLIIDSECTNRMLGIHCAFS